MKSFAEIAFVVIGLIVVAITAGLVLFTGWRIAKATPPKRDDR